MVAVAAEQTTAGTATGGTENGPLNKADHKPTKTDQVAQLRQQVDTVERAGQRIKNVVSAGS